MAVPQVDAPVRILTEYVYTTVQSSNFASNIYNVQQFSKYEIQVNITNASGLTAILKLQTSLDGLNWVDVPSSSQTVTTNTSISWDNGNTGSYQVRVFVTISAGSANFDMFGFKKL